MKKIKFIQHSTLISMVIIPFINEIYMFNSVILSVVKEELLIWEQKY
jgi:hypothetical protein